MLINLVYDAQALAAPASFRTALQTVANTLDATFTNNITINISVGYGEMQGTPVPTYGAYGYSLGNRVPYQTARSALLSHASSADDISSANTLPNTPAIQGNSNIWVATAQEKALGLFSGDANAIDGAVGFGLQSSSISNDYFTILALDVITHAMGRTKNNAPSVFTLVDFTSTGNRLFNLTPTTPPAYFSIDGGVTKLADFNQASDPSNFMQPPASTLTPNDPLDEGPKNNGTVPYLTPTDLRMMDVIGFTLSSPAQPGGIIDAMSVDKQLELIYLGYFNRSADSGGFSFWEGQNAHAQADPATGGFGQSAAVALTNIANSFTPQPETIAAYPFLGSANVNLADPAVQSQVSGLISNVYQNLFNHAPDAGGAAYWLGQLTSGAIPLGKAILAIANGATGADAIILQNKIAVALDFTTLTTTANLPVNAALLAEAKTVLAGVDDLSFNDASVTAAEALRGGSAISDDAIGGISA